ncbi:hypothetical protein NX059_004468 [Plenodomus lindquistii]|nr:hypothetical protein NX059_004468 [Plenodomus lindquistii]
MHLTTTLLLSLSTLALATPHPQYAAVPPKQKYDDYPDVPKKDAGYPEVTMKYDDYPKVAVKYDDYPKVAVKYNDYPKVSMKYEDYPDVPKKDAGYHEVTMKYDEYPTVSKKYDDYPKYHSYPKDDPSEGSYPSNDYDSEPKMCAKMCSSKPVLTCGEGWESEMSGDCWTCCK